MKPATGSLKTVIALCSFLLAVPALAGMSPRQIYLEKAPSVVLIVASQEGSSSASAGTGSIIRDDGMVITNAHVIYDESTKAVFPVVHVFMKPEKLTGDMNKDLKNHFSAEVVAFDRELDLALVKMKNPPASLKPIVLGNPDEVGPGDQSIAIGHPEQGGLWTITTGVISTEFENFKGIPGKHVFQMETSLNRGNSGGPLFDVRGYQVGVNTAIARQGAGGVAITGVNFAVKSSVVKNWAGQQRVELAFGSQALSSPTTDDTRVAVAGSTPTKTTAPAAKPETTVAAANPPAKEPSQHVYQDPASGGTIKVEGGAEDDTGEDDGEEQVAIARPAQVQQTEVKRPIQRKPERFEGTKFQTKRHPYTYKRLFTAVDAVRDRAKKAFDELDAIEGKRRR